MGKQQAILESRLIDPMDVSCSNLDEIQMALRNFMPAKSDFTPKPKIPRLTIRSMTDRAILGNLLLRAKALHRLCVPLSKSADLDNGDVVQRRGSNGRFMDNPNAGYCRWLKEALPTVSRSSANNYMNLAENVGLGVDKQPNFVLAPSVQSRLKLSPRKLYMKPVDFQDMLRKMRRGLSEDQDNRQFENHLFIKDSLKEMRISMGRVTFALHNAPDQDRAEVETFLEESLNQIRGIRKESEKDE